MTQRKAQDYRNHTEDICSQMGADSPLCAHVNIDFFAKMVNMTVEDTKECFGLSPDCQGVAFYPDIMGGHVSDEW